LVGALTAFGLARIFAGFRWGVVAAAMTVAVFAVGTVSSLIGSGLGEISSAGFLYLAVLLLLTDRGSIGRATVAGVLAGLGFYTRLNNLIMACGVAAFAIPPRLPVRAVLSPSRWLRHSARPAAVCIVAIIATALLLFASRTWLYTGVFSVFYGTQRDLLATWQPGRR